MDAIGSQPLWLISALSVSCEFVFTYLEANSGSNIRESLSADDIVDEFTSGVDPQQYTYFCSQVSRYPVILQMKTMVLLSLDG